MLPRLRIDDDAVRHVARGHPWVWEDAVDERPPSGTPVRLVDRRNRAVGFGLAEEEGPIAVRVLGRFPERIDRLLARRVAAADAAREGLLPPETDAYRVVNGAGDALPDVVLDRYGAVAVLQLHARCWLPHLDALVEAIRALPWVRTVLRRHGIRRVDERDGAERLWGDDAAEPLVVREAGLRFLARPSSGQKTGLFLDQREHRLLVGRWSRDREVLNLFGYTGGFSVHAAAGGARRTVTVDASAAALEDARENLRLNGLDPDAHGFVRADVFEWMPEGRPDLVVCDPPALSRARRSDAAARKAYRELAERCGRMLGPGGLLATASCTNRLPPARWEEEVAAGLRRTGRWAWLWRSAEPPDHPVHQAHPEGRYLKFGLLRRLA